VGWDVFETSDYANWPGFLLTRDAQQFVEILLQDGRALGTGNRK
jgi:hypothetical protein